MILSKAINRMRSSLLTAGLLTLATAASAQGYTYKSVPNDPMQTRIYTLKNGLTVYLSVNNEKPRIQTYIAVRTGSRNDPPETTGLAHYLEHLMFKGTTHFGTSNLEAERPYLDSIEARYEYYRTLTDPAQRKACYHAIDSLSQLAAQYNIPNEYDKMMASIGAEGTNAYTSNDVTCYVENIPSNEIDNWLKVESDRFQNMVIRGFHTELEAVYEEYNMGLAKDGNKLFTALMAKLFPTHPYGTQTTIGRGEHLKNPSITNIKNYFKRYYAPNNVAICMAGDFNPDEVIAKIDHYFGQWKPNPNLSSPQYAPMAPITSPQDTTIIGQEQAMVYLGWRFPEGRALSSDTLAVIGELLNNGRAGLMDLDINQQMKALGVFAGLNTMNEYSMFIAGGVPLEDQTLPELRQLMLDEIAKLKRGEFSDDLLPSVVNNMKRDFYKQLESNQFRANAYVDAFINRQDWEQAVGQIDRISKMTKAEIVAFANKYLNDNYVCVYKEQGVDTSIKKVEKPAITPIPTNNDKHSAFLQEVINDTPEPIQPVFVDYEKDMTQATTKKQTPMLYKQNTENGLFTLQLRYPGLGTETCPMYDYAYEYLNYVGTKKMTNEQIKQQLYKLACDYSVSQSDDELVITLQGLSENMMSALRIVKDLIDNGQADEEAWKSYVALVLKSRADNKANQEANFSALFNYGRYGEYNPNRNTIVSENTLKSMSAQTVLDYAKAIYTQMPNVLYYGPMSLADLSTQIDKMKFYTPGKVKFKMPRLVRPYKTQETSKNEVYIAPYDAKNVYMIQYHNANQKWTPERAPIISLFNEYFGGSMNAIVFQEMREARGLAYSASAYYASPSRTDDPEYFYTYIITQNDKMGDCIRQFNLLLDSIPEREAAVEVARQSLMKSIASSRTTKFGILTSYWYNQKRGLNYDLRRTIYEQLPKITLRDLVEFEKEYMAEKPYRYIILGDEKELDMDLLQKIGPIKRLSTEEIFGY